MNNWRSDLSESAEAFLNVVWPSVRDRVGGGEIVPVESVTDADFAKESLDQIAGIDAWQVLDNSAGMRGIASRVQFGDKSWDTFTIRYKRLSGAETEYAKRLRAIESGDMLYPSLTCHAYVSREGWLLAAGVARTKSIIEVIRDGDQGPDWYIRENRGDGVQFAVVPWVRVAGNIVIRPPCTADDVNRMLA